MMNPFDESPPPYDFDETKVIAPPPSYKAVMVEATPLPPPHFFEEDLDKLKKEMTLHEAKPYEYYLDLKKDIMGMRTFYENKIHTLEERILQLEKDNQFFKLKSREGVKKELKGSSLVNEIRYKINCVQIMVEYLNEKYPLHSTTNQSEYTFGYIYVRSSTQADVVKRGYNALVYHECGWISYRYPIPGTKFELELGDDPKVKYQGLLDITRCVVPFFEKYFSNTLLSKIMTGRGTPGDFSKESFMKHTMFNAKTSISYYGGGKYPSDVEDFKDNLQDESKILKYIHNKISNLYEYYQECILYFEPTFDFSTIF